MKVGVISSGSPDYLIDIVTDGLIRLLGRSSVSLDYNVRGGWGGGYVHLFQGFAGPEPFDIREAEVLVASSRSLPALKTWRAEAGLQRPVAFVDGEDHSNLDERAYEDAKVYFKREYLAGRPYPVQVRPLPFSAIPEEVPSTVEVTRTVFYSGHDTHPFRREVASALSEMGHPPAPNQEKALYNRCLMESAIGVAPRGNGWDTYRYWEVPYFGAALVAQRPGIVIPGNFAEDEEAVFFDGIPEMKVKVRRLLDHPSRLEKLCEAGRKACVARHLSTHRAKTVLEALI